jgi:hypothetical protein
MAGGHRGSWLMALACALCMARPALAQPTYGTPATPQQPSPTSPVPGVPTTQPRPGPGLPHRDPILPPAEAGTGIIRGHIVSLDTGSPLRRVQVRLMGGNLRPGRDALTDTQGNYEFKDLPAGRYMLVATKGGFVTLQYGQRGPTDTGRPIDLADRQTLPKLDMALPRGAVISGRVVDETGEAISDLPVAALQYRMFSGRRRLMPAGRNTTTNDLGQYRLYGLPPGEYYISVSSRAGTTFSDAQPDDQSGYAPTFYPGSSSIAEAQRLTLGVGEEIAADVQLTPTKLVRITGTVTESSGKPASSGFVSLQNRSADSAAPMMMSAGGTMVKPDGTFTVAGVAPGPYQLTVTTNMMPGSADQQREMAVLPITVAGQNMTDLRITTTRGITVSGHVTFEGGAPDATTTKQIRPMCLPIEPESMMSGSTVPMPANEQGQFELKAIMTPCLIGAFGFPPAWTLKSVTLNGSDITDRPIEPAGKAISGVEVTLTNHLTTLSGSVVDGQNQPAKEYTVVIFPDDRSKWEPSPIGQRYMRRARPDQSGLFKVTGLPPARYLVVALDTIEQGMESDPEFLAKIQSLATRAQLTEGGTETLSLKLHALPQ